MITTAGKTHIKRYMAGLVGAIGDSLALGIGATAEALGDTDLDFEILRVDVELVSYDFNNDVLVFKGTIPEEYAGVIYEVGLWSADADTRAESFTSMLLTSFDSETETWSGGSFSTANTRVGIDSLRLAPSANTISNASLTEIEMDLSGYSGIDRFDIAFNVAATTPDNIVVRFKTDSSNYYTWTITPGSGYQFFSTQKGALSATGSPSWSSITEIQVEVDAAVGGAAQVDFDAIRVSDTDTDNPDYALVAREVLSVPTPKVQGEVRDIEFTIPVAIA